MSPTTGPADALEGPPGLEALPEEKDPEPGFELLLPKELLLPGGGDVESDVAGGLLAPFPVPRACVPELWPAPNEPGADCELPGVQSDGPGDCFWTRALACALGIPGSSAITNRSQASRIASALKKQVACDAPDTADRCKWMALRNACESERLTGRA